MEAIKSDFSFHLWPGWPYLSAYALTGGLAGLSQAPVEFFYARAPYQHALRHNTLGWRATPTFAPSAARFLASGAPVLAARAALRFGAFGQFKRIRDVKRTRGTNSWPRWLDIGASGAAAGLVEAVVVNRITNPRSGFPHWTVLARHPAKLLCCFSTYGFLSTTLWDADKGPPKPFWKCWLMGAAAGATGSLLCSAAEGVRGRWLWWNAVPRGALGIGTLIAVQVTSCDLLLKKWEV